jgi:hypothetical protein
MLSPRKRERVDEVVVHAPVDDVHLPQPAGGARVDAVLVDDEVAALDDLDAHLAGQEAVLEVGRVVDPGRQQHDRGIGVVGRGERPQRREQLLRVVLDRQHPVRLEQRRERALHGLAVLEHVADARRGAQVVLEHVVVALLVAHEVGADDVRVEPAGDLDADHLAPEVAGAEDEVRRHHPLADDPLAVVDVLEEQVERGHALRQPPFQAVPLLARDHPRHQVEGEDALDPLGLAVHREGDALVQERQVGRPPARLELRGRQPAQLLVEAPVVGPDPPRRLEHLVEERPRLVARPQDVRGRRAPLPRLRLLHAPVPFRSIEVGESGPSRAPE